MQPLERLEQTSVPVTDVLRTMGDQRGAVIHSELALMTAQGKTPDKGWRLAVYDLPMRLDKDGRTIHDDFVTAIFPPGTDPWPRFMNGQLSEVYGQ